MTYKDAGKILIGGHKIIPIFLTFSYRSVVLKNHYIMYRGLSLLIKFKNCNCSCG